ncbi:acetly-coenzyme A synthetase [Vairimorpha necatrix]|uniref:acetate--CoA ligase n=1 Tax=Vairimorpha necatrix TaxID=6039 RepID=A0AAX4JEV6_9MICR
MNTYIYEKEYKKSISHNSQYWSEKAKLISWSKDFSEVFNNDFSNSKWFTNGKLNACYNCIDRHVSKYPNKVAIIYTDNDNQITEYTYKQSLDIICKISSVLKDKLNKGDCVTIYMPMCPEAVFSALACTRLGIVHNVVFGGFSSRSLRVRIEDSKSKYVITCDVIKRGKTEINFQRVVQESLINNTKIDNNTLDYTVSTKIDNNTLDYTVSTNIDNTIDNKVDNTVYTNFDSKVKDILIFDFENTKDNIVNLVDIGVNVIYWSDVKNLPSKFVDPVSVDSEDILFYLYTSGSTGKPKGMIHTTGGFLVYAALTTRECFNLKENDIFACTADIGWITGHTYSFYGPLLNGITTVLFGGTPVYPDYYRLFLLVDKLKITQLYTAPTVVRTLQKYFSTNKMEKKYDLSSLRLLGSVGEPINKEAYKWFTEAFNNLHIVDTYWQTETGGIMIAPLPNTVIGQPECASLPFYGIEVSIIKPNNTNIDRHIYVGVQDNVSNSLVDTANINNYDTTTSRSNTIEIDHVDLVETDPFELGHVVIKKSWPGISRGVLNDRKRYLNSYFCYKDCYFTGDEGYKDSDGLIWIRGRADDVINVSGHRLSTAELESAVCGDKHVAESAVVSVDDEITGQAINIFIVLKREVEEEIVTKSVRNTLRNKIGRLVHPKNIYICRSLPKTATGKIMRRVLRDIILGKVSEDLSTCVNSEVVQEIKKGFTKI